MQTGSSGTLIGWKSGQTLHGTEWRERGYGLWTLLIFADLEIDPKKEQCV